MLQHCYFQILLKYGNLVHDLVLEHLIFIKALLPSLIIIQVIVVIQVALASVHVCVHVVLFISLENDALTRLRLGHVSLRCQLRACFRLRLLDT